MPTIKATDDVQRWQPFSVIVGVIARNKAGEIEGLLELEGNLALVFLFDLEGAHWNWLLEDPEFTPNQAETKRAPIEARMLAQNTGGGKNRVKRKQ
jgi:hypothetical protein